MGCNCNKSPVKQVVEKLIGETFVDENIKQHRISKCLSCIFLDTSILNMKQCKKCGCFIDTKAQLLEQRCPIGKW